MDATSIDVEETYCPDSDLGSTTNQTDLGHIVHPGTKDNRRTDLIEVLR